MKKELSFYVLYPQDEKLKSYINAIKILSDINQRTEAHITVRGPYKNKLSNDFIDKYSKIVEGELLHISSVENFFAFNQNTVYFKCEYNEKLKRVWNKITYNDFKPHITLYDGNDRDFAVNLFNILAKDFKPFYYKVDKLSYLQPKTKDAIGLFKLSNVFKYNIFEELLNNKLTKDEINKLNEDIRLHYIEIISNKLYNEFDYSTTANNSYT